MPSYETRFGVHAIRWSIRVAICLACVFGAPIVANAADLTAPRTTAPPEKIYSTVLFSGFDDRTQSYYGYAGIVHALNGNLATDGFMFRALGLYNPYNYTTPAVPGGKVDGRMTAFDILFGYQKYFQNFVSRFYVGFDFEGHELTPNNPFDSNEGDHYGVHLRADLETLYYAPVYGSLLADYGSSTERYWVRGRAGYSFQGIIVGPEGLATGNRVANEQRVGAFVTFRNITPFELSFSGGYSHTEENRGGGSAYGTVELSLAL